MCDVPSWIKTPDAVLFLTDADCKKHGIQWNDATGHHAIRRVYPKASGTEGEGLGKDTPPEVVKCLLARKMNSIASVGKLLVRDGAWTLPIHQAGGVYVEKGASLTVPALKDVAGGVYVEEGASLTAPALEKARGVYVREGASLTVPALKDVAGDVYLREGASLTVPALEKAGGLNIAKGAKFNALRLKK